MSSLQIGSSDGSQGLTQHSPSHNHLPTPSTSSQTRKRRQVTKYDPSAILTYPKTPPQSSATNADWHNDGTDQIASSLSLLLDWLSIPGNYDSLKVYLKERGCTTSLTPPGIRSKVNGKALPFMSLHCDSSFLDNTPLFGLKQGQRLERWD
nr:hypothetical protein L203_02319 [Cryptococcus depauperatus CBS 7841]